MLFRDHSLALAGALRLAYLLGQRHRVFRDTTSSYWRVTPVQHPAPHHLESR